MFHPGAANSEADALATSLSDGDSSSPEDDGRSPRTPPSGSGTTPTAKSRPPPRRGVAPAGDGLTSPVRSRAPLLPLSVGCDEDSVDDEPLAADPTPPAPSDPPASAPATGTPANAAPTPNATASAPTRPMYREEPDPRISAKYRDHSRSLPRRLGDVPTTSRSRASTAIDAVRLRWWTAIRYSRRQCDCYHVSVDDCDNLSRPVLAVRFLAKMTKSFFSFLKPANAPLRPCCVGSVSRPLMLVGPAWPRVDAPRCRLRCPGG